MPAGGSASLDVRTASLRLPPKSMSVSTRTRWARACASPPTTRFSAASVASTTACCDILLHGAAADQDLLLAVREQRERDHRDSLPADAHELDVLEADSDVVLEELLHRARASPAPPAGARRRACSSPRRCRCAASPFHAQLDLGLGARPGDEQVDAAEADARSAARSRRGGGSVERRAARGVSSAARSAARRSGRRARLA